MGDFLLRGEMDPAILQLNEMEVKGEARLREQIDAIDKVVERDKLAMENLASSLKVEAQDRLRTFQDAIAEARQQLNKLNDLGKDGVAAKAAILVEERAAMLEEVQREMPLYLSQQGKK